MPTTRRASGMLSARTRVLVPTPHPKSTTVPLFSTCRNPDSVLTGTNNKQQSDLVDKQFLGVYYPGNQFTKRQNSPPPPGLIYSFPYGANDRNATALIEKPVNDFCERKAKVKGLCIAAPDHPDE